MSPYEIILYTNSMLIQNKLFSQEKKEEISQALLHSINDKKTIDHFNNSVNRYNKENNMSLMYPFFYIPPYNSGKKPGTLTMVTPHTHILSANAYELEILRLLALFYTVLHFT